MRVHTMQPNLPCPLLMFGPRGIPQRALGLKVLPYVGVPGDSNFADSRIHGTPAS